MRVGILGAGKIATSMATAINGIEGVSAYAVAARDLGRAQDFAKKWGFEKAYGSYEEMLADANVDLVYVATPHSHHFEHAKMCILANKPALVEKAFTANASQAKELLALAKEKKVFITEAIWTRYMPSRKLIDDVVASGIIGQVRRVIADLSYIIEDKGRLIDPMLAGGSLLDLGVYPINFAAMVMGNDIERITGTCTYCKTGVDCQEDIVMIYKDGRIATLTASMQVASHRLGMILGTKGYINCTNINNVEKIEVFNEYHEKIKEVEIPPQVNGYEYEVLACKRALEAGELECSEMPHEETIRIMEWMDELRKQWNIVYPFE